jgi:hypothetical protein
VHASGCPAGGRSCGFLAVVGPTVDAGMMMLMSMYRKADAA